MKTNQIMHRPFLNFTVRQMLKTGFFNATDITEIYNEIRVAEGKAPKEMDKYFNNKETQEFIQGLSNALNIPISEFKMVKRGNDNKGSWFHPELTLNYAKWLSADIYKEIVVLTGKETIAVATKRQEDVFFQYLNGFLDTEIIRQYKVNRFFIDFYLPEYNIAIEFDEKHHSKQVDKDEKREDFLINEIETVFIRVSEDNPGLGLRKISDVIESVKLLKNPKSRVKLMMQYSEQMMPSSLLN